MLLRIVTEIPQIVALSSRCRQVLRVGAREQRKLLEGKECRIL